MAIKSKQKYQMAQATADLFRQAIVERPDSPRGSKLPPHQLQTTREVLESILTDLEAEIAEYEKREGN
jgi:hypothetical protein